MNDCVLHIVYTHMECMMNDCVLHIVYTHMECTDERLCTTH